ncbi:MAG: hypothetical protein AB7L84_06030 [Acidimicrobiia bacterium]
MSSAVLRRVRNGALALIAVLALAPMAMPASGQESYVGHAGTDTSLPLTDSPAIVRGRGDFADLEITVNQTTNLTNQAVSITWTGGEPTLLGRSRFDGNYLQIMQCWGEDDGSVPGNPGPPPEQCVFGATDGVVGGRQAGLFPGGMYAVERVISRTDFPNHDAGVGVVDPKSGWVWRPFRAVDGEVVDIQTDATFIPSQGGGNFWLNPYFNVITTNEIPGARTSSDGTGAEIFEVTTGLESTGLGCGQRVQVLAEGDVKIPQCWLVIVPRGTWETENVGTPFGEEVAAVVTSPLSPSAWKNRIAIPLDFVPVDSPCSLADEQRRIGGTELALPAVGSWQRELCGDSTLRPFAYGLTPDVTARQQLLSGQTGAPEMIVVPRPLDPTIVRPTNPAVYAPLTLSATGIGFNIERVPRGTAPPEEEPLRGVRVADVNLTPRLVAKLLTQSYRFQTAIYEATPYEWAAKNPRHLADDPEFIKYNPEFSYLLFGGKNTSGLVMPSQFSDASRQVWEWIFADPEAKAWLDGEPDEDGMVVNPVYATTNEANANGVAFGSPVPETFPKSDPHCYQSPPQGPGGSIVPPPLCGTDWLPYTQSLRDAARLTRIADDGARTARDLFAISADQVYRRNGPQLLGSRAILSFVDTPTAATYGIQMAKLSRAGDNDDDREFVAPDVAGMTAALEAMDDRTVDGVLEPVPLASVPGAYPLTTVSYAATTPLVLDQDARREYAAFVDYAVGPGQVQGTDPGELPPGYAPLPPALQVQATAAAERIRTMQAPSDETTTTTVPVTNNGGNGGSVGPSAQNPAPRATTTTAPPMAAAPESSTPTSTRTVEEPKESLIATPILALARNRFVLPVLAVVALLSGLGALEITKLPRRGVPTTGGPTGPGGPA